MRADDIDWILEVERGPWQRGSLLHWMYQLSISKSREHWCTFLVKGNSTFPSYTWLCRFLLGWTMASPPESCCQAVRSGYESKPRHPKHQTTWEMDAHPPKIWNFQRISWVLVHPQLWLVIAAHGGMCCRLSGSCSGGCRFSGRWGGLFHRTRTWSLHGQWDKARSPPSHPRYVLVMCWFRGSKYSEDLWKNPKLWQREMFGELFDGSPTLWWTNIAIENGHRNSGFSH